MALFAQSTIDIRNNKVQLKMENVEQMVSHEEQEEEGEREREREREREKKKKKKPSWIPDKGLGITRQRLDVRLLCF